MSKPYIIGIAGGSGSGKTTLIRRLLEKTDPDAVDVIQHDWYYKHSPHLSERERSQVNYDHPDALDTGLLTAQLRELALGHPIAAPQYDYQTHLRKDETRSILPRPIIVVDGILIFTDKALRDLMDLKIYVDAHPDLRFSRRLERDVRHRGRPRESVVHQYLATVKPMHDHFVEPSRSHADIIIPNNGSSASLDRLAAKIIRHQF